MYTSKGTWQSWTIIAHLLEIKCVFFNPDKADYPRVIELYLVQAACKLNEMKLI